MALCHDIAFYIFLSYQPIITINKPFPKFNNITKAISFNNLVLFILNTLLHIPFKFFFTNASRDLLNSMPRHACPNKFNTTLFPFSPFFLRLYFTMTGIPFSPFRFPAMLPFSTVSSSWKLLHICIVPLSTSLWGSPWSVGLSCHSVFLLSILAPLLPTCNLSVSTLPCMSTRRELLREILYKNIALIAIQHGKFILLTTLAIFPILLGEIHSSPSGKFPYTN